MENSNSISVSSCIIQFENFLYDKNFDFTHEEVSDFLRSKDPSYIYDALKYFSEKNTDKIDEMTADILEYSRHERLHRKNFKELFDASIKTIKDLEKELCVYLRENDTIRNSIVCDLVKCNYFSDNYNKKNTKVFFGIFFVEPTKYGRNGNEFYFFISAKHLFKNPETRNFENPSSTFLYKYVEKDEDNIFRKMLNAKHYCVNIVTTHVDLVYRKKIYDEFVKRTLPIYINFSDFIDAAVEIQYENYQSLMTLN